jgi:glucokinase
VKAVGVDLGGTHARAALVHLPQGVVEREEKSTIPADSRQPEAVAALVAALVARVDPDGQRIGVGVGFAGMLRGFTGVVVNAPNFGWRDVALRSLLRGHLGENVELYNDVNAIAFGEARYGNARAVADVLCVFVGTGIGGGLVLNGRLYSGATHLAGEIGHVKVVPGGRLCGCGQRGCLEAYASGVHLRERALEELHDCESLALDLAGSLERLHAGHLDEAARHQDGYASRLWDEVAGHLGTVLANAVTIFNPARLVMGGGVWQGAPELRTRTEKVLRRIANAPSLIGFQLVDTALGDSAGVLGAATLVAEAKGGTGQI